MSKYSVGDVLTSKMTACGLQYGKKYIVKETKYKLNGFVYIQNDEGYFEYYDDNCFELSVKEKYENQDELEEKISKLISTLQPIECMGFKCKYAHPDEYNWVECRKDLRGYITSFVENDERRILCPYYE